MGVIARLDRYQRRHRWVGLPLAVLYKYVDDQGGYLAALITYYGFLSVFPLLLLFVTVLGFVLHGDVELQQQFLGSALVQFPIVGDQIGHDIHAVHGSVAAVVIGVLACLYGGIGVVQALQNALNTAWAVPRNSRPNPVTSRLRSLGLLVVFGGGLLATTVVSVLTSTAGAAAGGIGGQLIRTGALLVAVALNAVLFTVVFRVLPARSVTVRQVRGGALGVAVGWQVLQTLGTYLVGHQLKHASASYGVFGVVLGLIAFLYLAASLVVFCAESNVVRAEELWPRSLLTPFTDNVQLTGGDRRAYASYAAAQRAKGFQQINTDFHPPESASGRGSTGADQPR